MSTLPGLLIAAALLFDPARTENIDLTHTFDEKTLYWPTSPSGFEHRMLTTGKTQGGCFYSAAAFCGPEHGGAHLDAPIHFSEGGHSSATVPLDKLVAPAIVVALPMKIGNGTGGPLRAIALLEEIDSCAAIGSSPPG